MRNLILAGLLFIFVPLAAQDPSRQAQESLIGSKLNELKITDYLANVPDEPNFDNKFKVIEFWATWCKPCLAAVPHLNKLQRRFAGADSLVFLSMTSESPTKVEKTLAKVNFETVVVSDQTETTHRNLNIRYDNTMGLPRTVLVDNHNTILWYGPPHKLTPRLIQKFLNGEKLK